MFRHSARSTQLMALVSVAVSGCLLAGCSSDSSGSASSSGPLEVWTRSDAVDAKAYQKIFAAFTKKTGIKVDYKPVVDFDKLLQQRAASKNLPDVTINDMGSLGNYQSQGLLEPVDKSAIAGGSDLTDKSWVGATGIDGKYYGVPFSAQAQGMYIRKDWLAKVGKKAPTTWAELLDVAKAFTTKDPDGDGKADTYGILSPGSTTNGYLSWWTSNFVFQAGGEFVGTTGDGKYEATAASDATVAGVKYAEGLYCDSKVVQPSALTMTTGDSYPFFDQGKVGIVLTGPYQFPRFDATPGKDKYEIIPVPKGPAGNTVLAEGENVYLMAGSKKTAEQKKLAEFLITPEAQKIGMTAPEAPVVRLSVNKTVDNAAVYKDDRWKPFEDAYNNSSEPFPSAINYQPIRQDTADALNKLFADCGKDVKGAMATLDNTVQQELKSQGVAK
ncbi:ABC transporter substrate-binding protein [Streptomyces fuscichromogenes]|uniref:ABC transporter substrate-binding protein n=1 Tax=Streptomyces fuscichromogenes TaxID=1324013 RepID=UPI0038021F59